MNRDGLLVLNGVLGLDGWAGYTEQPVLVVGETPRRYRIRAIAITRLAGRGRYLEAGEETLVPKTAVRFCASTPSEKPPKRRRDPAKEESEP